MSGFRKPHVITRQAAGTYVDGEYVPGGTTTINITASVQPATMEDLINLPVGRRLSDFIRLYTSTELFTLTEGDNPQQPDMFDWHGHTYECFSVGMWQNNVISHWKCIFVKVSQE